MSSVMCHVFSLISSRPLVGPPSLYGPPIKKNCLSPLKKKKNILKKSHFNGDTIRIGQKIQCLLYAGFLFELVG